MPRTGSDWMFGVAAGTNSGFGKEAGETGIAGESEKGVERLRSVFAPAGIGAVSPVKLL